MFIATHSIFLLRELELLLQEAEFAEVRRKFIGLVPSAAGTLVEEEESLEELNTLTMLDEEIDQSERYLRGAQV